MSKTQKDNNYLPYLDGLRGLAAIYVVLHHTVSQFFFDYSSLNIAEKYSIIPFFQGHFAVNFFIVLSGFCLTIPMVKKDCFILKGGAIQFYKKRIRRIVFPYYLALLFSLIFIQLFIGNKTGRHWDLSFPVTKWDAITHLLLIQDIFSTTMFKINHVLWTISVEFRIYLLFPVLLWVWRKYGPLMCLLTTFVISLIIFIAATFANGYGLGLEQGLDGVNPYIILFGLGMLAAYISLSNSKTASALRVDNLWLAACILLFIMVLFLQKAIITWPYAFELLDIVFGCWSLTFLILVSGSKFKLLKRIFSFRPLVFVGTFAYSIYLIHAPLIPFIWQYLVNPLHLTEIQSYYLTATGGTIIITGISYLFYLLFERPFMNHKKPV